MKIVYKVLKWIGIVIGLLISIIIVLGIVYAPDKPKVAEVVVAQAPVVKVVPIAAKPVVKVPSKLTWKQVQQKSETMTDLQFEDYGKWLSGTYVKWKGIVTDVKSQMFGSNFDVHINFDNNKQSSFDTKIEVSRSVAVKLNKGQVVVVEGTIDKSMEAIGMVFMYFKNDTTIK